MSVITLEEAKNYLRVDTNDDDELINLLILTAEDLVERFTWRVLLTKTFELIYDEAGDSIEIIKSPLQEVVKIEVINDSGIKTEVDKSIYFVDTTEPCGRISLKTGAVWPPHRGFASFIITVKAGYGDTVDSVPPALRQAVLSALEVLYNDRGQIDEAKVYTAISGLCAPYRIFKL